MTKAIALARTHIAPLPLAEFMRAGIVLGCALALIAAGPVLPF